MNVWAVIIIVFAVAMLPWQIFRYAKRRNDSIPKSSQPTSPEHDDADGFW